MRRLLPLLFVFAATLALQAGPDAWLEDGLFKPEIIQQIKPKLGLSPDQESRMGAIIAEARKKGEPFESALKEQREALHDMLRQSTTTADSASAQLSKVLESEAAIKQLHLRMLIDLRDVLTPEQQKQALTLGAPKAAAQFDIESQMKTKAARLHAAVESLGAPPTVAMKERGAEIERLARSGDLHAAAAALDKLVADSEVDEPESTSAVDFSKYETGATDLETLKQRFQTVGERAQSVVSVRLFRRLLKAKDALEAAKAAEDAATVGRILTWAEKTLEEAKSKPPAPKPSSGAALTPKPPAVVSAEPVKLAPSGPRVIKAGDAGVGRMVPDLGFTDITGVPRKLSELSGEAGIVIAMTTATCPVSKRYMPSLATLEKELRTQRIALLLVNPFGSESSADIQAQLSAAGVTATYVHDKDQALATALGARATTEVFLLDAKRTIVYRGALDDQYGLTYNLDAPRANYLRDAVAAMRRNQLPRIAATEAPGCELGLADARNQTEVTYHRDVERILQQNCVACHHEKGIAPFGLDDLAEVQDRAKTIKRVISDGVMPPWFAAPLKEGNPWGNDRSLGARDKADLLAWLGSSNRPLGDAHEAPAKLVLSSEWSIGTPDLIVQLPQPVAVKADGFMPYQTVTAQTTLTEDKWVQAYEILPTDRSVVHHVLVNVHANGANATREKQERDSYWAVYVPGNGSQIYPQGFARKLPAGATVTFQIHYTPSGKAVQEQLRMGLVFAKETPRFAVETAAVVKRDLDIPPGDANHVETFERPVPTDLNVIGFMPHMHVRGKAFKYELIGSDGSVETLLDIPRYDFNWQLRYEYAQPRTIPRGSKIRITAAFDNSPGNTANPDPTKRVRWGQQTYEEMMIGFIEHYVPIPQSVAAK